MRFTHTAASTQVYTTCQNILSDPHVEALELFHVWHDGGDGGAVAREQEQELLPGGASLLVTDSNKMEYVQLLAHHLVVTVVEEQVRVALVRVCIPASTSQLGALAF